MLALRARFEASLLTRPPRLLRTLLPGCEWTGPPAGPTGTPRVYLTFDDGPIPEETPWVLTQLAEYQARATFFCVGENLVRYPEIARAVLAAGHRLGNHTHRHRSAWNTAAPRYQADVAQCQALVDELGPAPARPALFRPPYGRLTGPLLRALAPEFRVVMWSVLTRDYDPGLSPENCLRFALAAIRAGDVVVFHDSRKASLRLRFALPRVLAHLAAQGVEFAAL